VALQPESCLVPEPMRDAFLKKAA